MYTAFGVGLGPHICDCPGLHLVPLRPWWWVRTRANDVKRWQWSFWNIRAFHWSPYYPLLSRVPVALGYLHFGIIWNSLKWLYFHDKWQIMGVFITAKPWPREAVEQGSCSREGHNRRSQSWTQITRPSVTRRGSRTGIARMSSQLLWSRYQQLDCITHQMVRWCMNWKGFGRKGSWTNRCTIPAFTWRHWGKPNLPGQPVLRLGIEPGTSRTQVRL
jgi:hypothetical protein